MAYEDINNIRPVNPRFFGAVLKDNDLSLSAKDALVNEALSGRGNLDKARSQLVESQQRERLGAIRIEREEFALSEARDKAAKRGGDVATAGSIGALYRDLLDDPELGDEDKRKAAARIRFNNADAFSRNPALRDSYDAFDDILPKPARSLTPSEALAQVKYKASLEDAERKRIEGERKDKEEEAEEAAADYKEDYNEDYTRVTGFKFPNKFEKEGPNKGSEVPDYSGDFLNPGDRNSAIGFLERHGAKAGVNIPSEKVMEDMTAGDLLELIGKVDRKARINMSKEIRNPGASKVSGLNIPKVI
tara:strand:- start:3038 stop:3949 length:912 start_codon:yes stop_codon:yes gene_type:complete